MITILKKVGNKQRKFGKLYRKKEVNTKKLKG